MKGRFAIAASFLQEGSAKLDLLFGMMIVNEKSRVGDAVIYQATSGIFAGKDATDFVIGYKDGKFEAFPAEKPLPEGYVFLNEKGATLEEKKTVEPVKKAEEPVKKKKPVKSKKKKIKEPAEKKTEPPEKSNEEIAFYRVLVDDMVKNKSGFLNEGAEINDTMEFDDSIEDMLAQSWIERIETQE